MFGNLYRVDVLNLLDAEANQVLSQWSEHFELGNRCPNVSNDALVEAFRERRALADLLKMVRDDLKYQDLSIVPFLSSVQKIHLRQKLIRAHYLTFMQASIDNIECRWDGLLLNLDDCERYASFIRVLDLGNAQANQRYTDSIYQMDRVSSKPLSWFGARHLSPMIATSMVELCAGNTASIKNLIMEMDRQSTYLGWSRSFVLSFFTLLPQFFAGDASHLESLRHAGDLFPYIGLCIVNTRFAMESYLLIKNTFAGAWATRRQAQRVDVWSQFSLQVRQRCFNLLNSMFLSVLSVISFLCLIGGLEHCLWMPLVPIGLRLVQLLLIALRYAETKARYHEDSRNILKQIQDLNHLETKLREELSDLDSEDEKMAFIFKLKTLEQDRLALILRYKKIKNDWLLKKDEFWQQTVLSTCLFSGVMMFSCLLLPSSILAPPIGLIIGFTGASMCIVFVVALALMRANFMIEQTRREIMRTHQKNPKISTLSDEQFDLWMRRFMELKQMPGGDLQKENEMKQCYLNMRILVACSKYQAERLNYQKFGLCLTCARDILAPLIFLSSFIFISTPIGLSVVFGIFLLHFFIKKIMDTYQPAQPGVRASHSMKFDEQAYQVFMQHPSEDTLKNMEAGMKNKLVFWSDKSKKDHEVDDFVPNVDNLKD